MNTEIHPELQKIGKLMKFIFRPNKLSLRFFRWASTRKPNAQIPDFSNATHHVKRTRGDGDVRVRVYGPLNQSEDLPVVLYFHGGGYAINSPEAAHQEISIFLKARPCIVVAPDYTKSLDAPYPAAINDCEDTLDWLLANASELGIRSDKLVIGGHSAGGGLTLALMLRLRERGDVSVAFQMPIYPMIDHHSNTASAADNDMPVWNTKLNKLAWRLYLGELSDDVTATNVPADAAPAQAKDYVGLPPAITYVGDLDPFLDETINMVDAFKRDGVAVDFKVYEQCFHAFDLVEPSAEPSKEAINFLQRKFSEALDTYTVAQP